MTSVSVQEAASRLGVSVETIRRRIRSGQVSATRVTTPQGFVWQVELPDQRPEPETNGSGYGVSGNEENENSDEQILRELVATLQAQVLAQQEQLNAKDQQISELHILLQQTQKALPSPSESRPWWRRLWR